MNLSLKRTLASLLLLAIPSVAGDYSGWGRYRIATLNTGSLLTAGVGKIPVPIRLTAATQPDLFTGAYAAATDGSDLRVTKADGSTDLPFEIESWTTGASGSGVVWILLDTVVPASSYPFRLYWNQNGVASASNGSGVFSPANGYLAAWHFNQAAGATLKDATGVHDATPGAASAAPTHNAAAVLGAGKTFDGTQFYQIGTNASAVNLNTNTGPFTITAWANVANCNTRVAVLSKYANSNTTVGGRQYVLQTAPTTQNWRFSNDPAALSSLSTNNEYVADDAASCTSGAWTWLAVTYSTGGVAPTADSAGARNLILRVNTRPAVRGGAVSSAQGSSIGTNSLAYIGKIASNDRYMNGSLDEIAVSNVLRSEDWLKLSHETQKPASTAIQVAAESVIQHLIVGVAPKISAARPGTAGSVKLVFLDGRVLLKKSAAGRDPLLYTLEGKRHNGTAARP
jgi:hypothetical protein